MLNSMIERKAMDILKIVSFILLSPWMCECRIINSPRQARLSLAEPLPSYYYNNIGGNPGAYSFGYDVPDPSSGGNQYRSEERFSNGTVFGSYGYVDAAGKPQRYRYVADERGYRVMRDRSFQRPQYNPTTSYPITNSITSSPDSITWSRGKKGNQKKNNYKQSFMKNWQQNLIQPPSYFANYYYR